MRRTRLLALAHASIVLLSTPALAQNPAGVVIHMTEADFSQGCARIDDASLACADVQVVGNSTTNQFAWILAYGWNTLPGWGGDDVGLSAAAFAVSYPPQTTVLNWTGCTDLEIPLQDELIGDWPDPDTGIAVAFGIPGGYNPESRFATLGFLLIQSGSSGRMRIVRHAAQLIDAVQFVSSEDLPFDIPAAGHSAADVGGDMPSNGQRTCEGTIPLEKTSWGRVKAAF